MQSLVLGTAQWGSDYGITNPGGRLSDDSMEVLLGIAGDLDLTFLDTAPAYGDAEARIGQIASTFDVQTKVTLVEEPESVRNQVSRSCELLQQRGLWGVLAHNWPALSSESRITGAAELSELVHQGFASRAGVSVYEEADLLGLPTIFPDVGVIQVPVNLLDQRLVGNQEITELRACGVQIQARSVFLQGLLVVPRHGGVYSSHSDLEVFREAARKLELSPLSLALGFIRSQEWIDEVVVAPTSGEELIEIHAAWTLPIDDIDWSVFASEDIDLIDPRRWT